jgi:8-oxo-dGTP pyrophosphatase MutT (NUDIX family)
MDVIEMFAHDEDAPPAIPAATLVIFRNAPQGGAPQVLMVQRAKEMRFAGGAAVFPGGRVDEADRVLAVELGASDDEAIEELSARIAAVRETLEETGLAVGFHQRPTLEEARRARGVLLERGELAAMLAELGWTLDLERLVPFSRWRPRHKEIRVFDTRFYLANLGTGDVDLAVDDTENTHLFWASAADALAMADSGEIKVIFPTRRNLERLAQFASFDDALGHVETFPSRMITPFMEMRDGQPWLVIPADAGYPVDGEKLESAARG